MLESLLISPLATIWRWALSILIIDTVLILAEVRSPLAYLRFDRESAWIIMIAAWAVYNLEKSSGFALRRLIIGKRVRFRMTRDWVSVGGWFVKKRFPRTSQITFGMRPVEHPQSEIYQRSMRYFVIIDDARRIPLGEIFGEQEASHLVENANVALQLAMGRDGHLDVDPARLKRSQHC